MFVDNIFWTDLLGLGRGVLNKMGGLVLALEFINWGGHNKLKPVIFSPKIGDYPPPPSDGTTIRVRRVVKKQMKYLMLNLKVTYYIYIISNAWNSKYWSNCASPIKPLSSETWQLLFYAKIISTPKQCFVKIKQVSFAKQKIRNCIVKFFDCKHLVLSTIFFLETSEYFWNW